jgi:serine/threonine protein kinase
VVYQALKSHGIPLNKGCVLWTLRQLCACQETLPESCVLPIEFKPSDPHHAAGGFADVWKGIYDGRDVAFKSIRASAQSDGAARLKRKVDDIFLQIRHIPDLSLLFQRRFCKEVVLWKSLNHSNILGLVGVCQWDNTPEARLTMVSEWMTNGNITEYIEHNESQRMQLVCDYLL